MSCYEWEEGTIKIPSKEWASFRKAVIASWNEFHLRTLALAEEAYAAVKDAPPPVHSWETPLSKWREQRRIPEADFFAIDSLLYERTSSGARKIRRPLKGNLPLLPISSGATLSLTDATIVLDDSTHTVGWSVGENNHAREHARAHPVAQAFFGLLGRMTWTRGSGGAIVGNDEYNRDSRDSGGGGNYTTAEYGPARKPRRFSVYR